MKSIKSKVRNIFYYAGLLGLLLFCGCCRTNRVDTITILHTNDVHAHLLADSDGHGGWANIAAYVKNLRKTQKNVLLLDAGDMTQGTAINTILSGKPIFHVMNAVGYDYATLGNHEFDNGVDCIQEFRDIADFELLSANIYSDGSLVANSPVALLDVDGVKVGIIGITTPDFLCAGLDVLSSEEVVAKYVAKLEDQADLIIALTHLGLEKDKKLAAATSQIDVIVGGHSHTKLDKPIKINNTLIVQNGPWGWHLGRLDLKINLDTGKILKSKGKLIVMPFETLAPDPETKQVIDEWQGKIPKQVYVKIGYNPSHLSMPQVRKRIGQIWQQAYQTDFAHQTPGGTRYPLPKGDILISNIYDIMPFNRTLLILKLNREQINNVIENPEFNQDKDFYTCITNDHIGNKLIEQFNLSAERVARMDVSWREPIIEYIKANGKM